MRTFRGYYYRGSGLDVGSVSDEAFCALLVSFERGQMEGCAAVFRAMVDVSLKKRITKLLKWKKAEFLCLTKAKKGLIGV